MAQPQLPAMWGWTKPQTLPRTKPRCGVDTPVSIPEGSKSLSKHPPGRCEPGALWLCGFVCFRGVVFFFHGLGFSHLTSLACRERGESLCVGSRAVGKELRGPFLPSALSNFPPSSQETKHPNFPFLLNPRRVCCGRGRKKKPKTPSHDEPRGLV